MSWGIVIPARDPKTGAHGFLTQVTAHEAVNSAMPEPSYMASLTSSEEAIVMKEVTAAKTAAIVLLREMNFARFYVYLSGHANPEGPSHSSPNCVNASVNEVFPD